MRKVPSNRCLLLGWALATIVVLCTVLMFVPGPTGGLWLLDTVAAEQALIITAAAPPLALAALLRRRVGFVVIGVVAAVASAGGHLVLLAAYAPREFPPSCDVAPVPPSAVVALVAPTDLAPLHGLDSWRYPDLGGIWRTWRRSCAAPRQRNPQRLRHGITAHARTA